MTTKIVGLSSIYGSLGKSNMEQTTKIIGGLSEFKQDKSQGDGLLNRLRSAKTSTEIDYLLGVGKTYKNVTVGTIRKWEKVASKKKGDLKS